ncbi:hypothetical protein F1188_07770 [Roseospira marina]|uniref:Uncharacterized protein n=1 Tax=Roseospira marina TaxID=140057 RepID=A0A5M6IDG4_9PROT|nr:hypothetical protein [Roseospira marina]KAA5606306.1 hypothetical protein F1188_07770 [Roseospira marina]MBB4314467.1 hypothetical protein [Roseospira marina]MBB5087627.1 hypothetical protein [Roseospira marina]
MSYDLRTRLNVIRGVSAPAALLAVRLDLVKGIIERHGSALGLTSTVGVGTTVTRLFPADRVLDRGAAPDSSTAP